MAIECMVNIWGGAWNTDANPSIEKDLGIKEGAYYFDNEELLDCFITLISQDKYRTQGVMVDKHVGDLTHKQTVFVGQFKYLDDVFTLRYNFGYEYPAESAEFMFTLGNYSCDCNRSTLIREQHGEDSVPDLDCGWDIELLDYHIEYED